MPADRDARLHVGSGAQSDPNDTRSASARDRDRILYTAAFRRLAGVTQVVGAAEGHVFHNRLTHTLEVAQIARRVSERFRHRHGAELDRRGLVLDPEVAEAAAFAHDLGHPPFGHLAEKELDRCLREGGDSQDGYEGNAQSFRIVTRLAAHRQTYRGLNLTRATLNAILKYPWLRGDGPPSKPDKFGAYRSERVDFDFARDGSASRSKSLEADIMDHADAVAYSVHDLDDFYRAGLIPLEDIHADFSGQIKRFRASGKVDAALLDEHESALKRWFALRFPRERYTGDHFQRTALRAMNAQLIHEFVSEIEVALDDAGPPRLVVPPLRELQIRFLQNILWTHVIQSPRLATQQHGQRRVIRELYAIYREAIDDRREAERLIPAVFRRELETLDDPPGEGAPNRAARAARLAADIVAGFTDAQAVGVYRRLTGVTPGSVMDLLEA